MNAGILKSLIVKGDGRISNAGRFLGFLVLAISSLAFGTGVTGSMVGVVSDPQNAVIVNARITARDLATNTVRETSTDERGQFSIPLLPPGAYEVSVDSEGFDRDVLSSVRVDIDAVLRLDFKLLIGSVKERIEVSSEPPLVESENATVGEVIGHRKISTLPLNERNFLTFTLLVPGAQSGTDGSQNMVLGSAISVNGAREQSNNFLLDGVDNNDAFINQFGVLPSVEAIEEFKVQSSNSSAEFGRSGGAQINVALKSGSNQIHGSLFEYLRNRHLDAKNYFDLPACPGESIPVACGDIPRFDRDQFGGSVGGPIRKDKTFFFIAYEGLHLRQAITREATVPSQLLRAALEAAIPPFLINPAGQNVLNLIPAANVGPDLQTSTRYIAAPTLQSTEHLLTLRLDQHIGGRNHLSGHYALYDDNRFNPLDPGVPSFSNLPGFGSPELSRGQNVGITWISEINSHATNEARFGFNRSSFGGFLENAGQPKSLQLGFPETLSRPVDLGYPDIQISGYDGIGESTSLPMQRNNNTFIYGDNLAWHPEWNAGRHQFKFGGEIRRIENNSYIDEFSRGFWSFLGITGNPIEDLLLGAPAVAIQVSGNTFTNLRTTALDIYFQDDIQINSRFVLNTGLRYEYNSPPTDAGSRLTVPDLSPKSATCTPAPDCMFITAGANGVPRGLYDPDRRDFAPRIGFAWRPFATDRFVVRSGYGIFYDVAILNTTFGSRLNPPSYPIEVFINSGTNNIQNIFSSPIHFPLAFTIAQNYRDPYMQQWNLGTQTEVRGGILLDLSYVGSKGSDLLLRRDANQPRPGGIAPYPQFTTVQQIESAASSNYNSLQARAVKQYKNGLEFSASYTFSKSIDNASQLFSTAVDPGFPQDSDNLGAERALSDFDARHRLVVSYVYALPSLHKGGWMSGDKVIPAIFSNLVIGGIATWQTGRPFTVNRSILQSRTGIQAYIDRPDQIADPMRAGPVMSNPDPSCHSTISQGGRAADVTGTPSSWFNPCAFSDPNLLGQYRFGTAPRNSVTGPDLVDFDISLSRNIKVTEHNQFQLRAEVFNIFNHPNFDVPDRIFDSPTFGSLISANAYGNRPPRQLQLCARYMF
jgi:Carboxypeptidase regulatory-like domain/TonB dependent receptor